MRYIRAFLLLASLNGLVPIVSAEPMAKVGANDVPKVFFGYSTRYQETAGDEHGSLRIRRISPRSPAAAAGLLVGDEITAFNSVPFRFENDIQAIRAMAWVKPGEPLELTVRRDGEVLALRMVPIAADPEQQRALSQWLDRLEREGKACFSCQDEGPEAAEAELLRRIRESGGKAMLKLERDGSTVRITSSQVDIPTDFKIDPAYAEALRRLPPGKAYLVLVKVDGLQSEWLPQGAPGFEQLD